MGRIRRLRSSKKRSKQILTKEDVDKDVRVISLLRYLKEMGWENEQKLRIGEFKGTGKGVYSMKNIKPGEDLIKMPKSAIITMETLEKDLEFVDQIREILRKVENKKASCQYLLAMYLALYGGREKCGGGTCKIYTDTLPRNFSVPYFCDKKEMLHLDEHLLTKMVEQKQNMKKYEDFLDYFEYEVDNLEFETCYFMVNTRGVYIDPSKLELEFFNDILDDAPSIALVPFLDFFNHSDKAVSIASTNGDFYTLKTENSYKKYEQIFISYGAHNNLKLLLEYGFVIPGNQHDLIEITMTDIANLIKHDAELRATQIPRPKFQFISNHNLSDQMFFDCQQGASHNLQCVLFMVFLEKNVHNLRNVAFGDALNVEEVTPFVKKLLEWKILEYKKFVKGLKSIKYLTDSGKMCVLYYQESICYLENCQKLFYKDDNDLKIDENDPEIDKIDAKMEETDSGTEENNSKMEEN